jgi:putative N6-adenine-specific DNA methylase
MGSGEHGGAATGAWEPEAAARIAGPQPFFATAARGTEGALRDELRALRLPEVRAERGGVRFGGGRREALRAALWSRVAVRVLWQVAECEARDGDDLYAGVRDGFDWRRVLDARRTLAVSATVRDGSLTHSGFVALRTKDAIVDALRDRIGARPSVDRDDPDVGVFVHLVRDRATVYLDVGGGPLHLRGYRASAREAPLKETLAAAILRLGGWDRRRPLADPMCGSGTFVIEAAQWARGLAPGLLRPRFGAERWADHDAGHAAALEALRVEARDGVRGASEVPALFGGDVDPRAIAAARDNARRARVADVADFAVQDLADLGPADPPGHVFVNPPYGVRLAGGPALDRHLARALRRLEGHRVTALVADRGLERALRPLRPAQEHAVWNGDIECRVMSWEIP